MSNVKGKIEATKDKLMGGVKETVGKVTGNEKLELKGKIQTKKAVLEEKASKSLIKLKKQPKTSPKRSMTPSIKTSKSDEMGVYNHKCRKTAMCWFAALF